MDLKIEYASTFIIIAWVFFGDVVSDGERGIISDYDGWRNDRRGSYRLIGNRVVLAWRTTRNEGRWCWKRKLSRRNPGLVGRPGNQ